MAEILACPHCGTRIIPSADGTCPACGKDLAAPVAPVAPPRRRRRRHPLLNLLGLALVVGGLWLDARRTEPDANAVAIDLAVVWAGCMLLLVVNLSRRFR